MDRMWVSEVPFRRCDVMAFGREMERVTRPDGRTGYEPSYRTLEVADTVGAFAMSYSGVIERIVTSGGYPRAARNMEKPLDGSSEADFMKQRLLNWGVTAPIFAEGNSTNTFQNLSESINNRLLRLGQYTEEDPLVIACNEAHAARTVMLTRYALNLMVDGSNNEVDRRLYILRSYPEIDLEAREKERRLAKVTKYAINLAAAQNHFPPGSLGSGEHLHAQFRPLWTNPSYDTEEEREQDRSRLIQALDEVYGPNWEQEDLRRTEVIDYTTAA